MRNQGEAATHTDRTVESIMEADYQTSPVVESSSEPPSSPYSPVLAERLEPHPWALAFDPVAESRLPSVRPGLSRAPEVFIFEGRVMHPWSQYLASVEMGIEPKFTEVDPADPIGHLAIVALQRQISRTGTEP